MSADLDLMRRAARLAGHSAAHGVWSVSDGAPLTPFCAFETADGERSLTRFAFEDQDAAFKAAVAAFVAGAEAAVVGALVYPDVFIRHDMGLDAVYVAAKGYPARQPNMRLAVTYAPDDGTYGFSVFDPEVMEHPGIDASAMPDLLAAFWEGRDSHEEAAAIWKAADEGPSPI